jgi:hypothetical protein
MYHNYDSEEDSSLGESEKAALKMVDAYTYFVITTYNNNISYESYEKIKNKPMFSELCKVARKILDARLHPQDYISFQFENWKNVTNRHHLAKLHLSKRAGVAFPSWKYICGNKSAHLLARFLQTTNYTPKVFYTSDQWGRKIERWAKMKIRVFCAKHNITENQLWLNLDHITEAFDPSCYSWFKHIPSLWRIKDQFEKTHGFTINEMITTLEYVYRTRNAKSPNIIKLKRTKEESKEINFISCFLSEGVDVETPRFEAKLSLYMNRANYE